MNEEQHLILIGRLTIQIEALRLQLEEVTRQLDEVVRAAPGEESASELA